MYGNCLIVFLACTAAALQMTGPSTYTASVGSIAHIPCTFTARELPADPRFLAVDWYLEGNIIRSDYRPIPSPDPRYSLDKERALYGIADLTISNALVSDAGNYTCSVIYSPYQREKGIRVDISAAALQMTGPSTYTASAGSIAHIPCTFTADTLPADPRYFTVVWYLEGKIILTTVNNVTSPDPRYSLDKERALYGNADLTISNALVSDAGNYTCSVIFSHFRMEKQIRVESSAQPQLSILTKSVQRNTENTLACTVTGFFPPDIDVIWYKDGEVLNNQLMGEPHKNDNGTYQVISTVTITPSDDDQNRTFFCRVQHISLQEPLQEDIQLLILHESLSPRHFYVPIIVVILVIITAVSIGIVLWKWKRRRKGQLPDLEVGQITVPELIAGENATLTCKLYNYIPDENTCSWSTGNVIPANYDGKKMQWEKKDETSDDQNTFITYLVLLPVEKSDDGSEFILRVNLPDRVIERSSGAVHVRANLNKSEKETSPSKLRHTRHSDESGITMYSSL